MTTLIPKFDLKNGGSTPTGAVNRTISEKLSDIICVKVAYPTDGKVYTWDEATLNWVEVV